MKLIVGLGNPGREYKNTRHNAGFLTLDLLAKELGISVETKKFKSLIGEGFHKGEKIILVKPQTYMNVSGESVELIMDYFDIDLDDLLVISDDMDLSLGSIRIKEKGSSGGQRGIASIIKHLGTSNFSRLRIGIGKSDVIPVVDYVLGKIDDETAILEGSRCALDFIEGMSDLDLKNKYNRKNGN